MLWPMDNSTIRETSKIELDKLTALVGEEVDLSILSQFDVRTENGQRKILFYALMKFFESEISNSEIGCTSSQFAVAWLEALDLKEFDFSIDNIEEYGEDFESAKNAVSKNNPENEAFLRSRSFVDAKLMTKYLEVSAGKITARGIDVRTTEGKREALFSALISYFSDSITTDEQPGKYAHAWFQVIDLDAYNISPADDKLHEKELAKAREKYPGTDIES